MTVGCTPYQVRRCPSLVINLAWRARCCLPRAVPLSGRSIGPQRSYCFETSRCRHALQQVPRLDRSRWVGSTHTGAACKCSPRRLASFPTGGWAQPDAQLRPDGWSRVVRGATELPRGATERPEPPRARAVPDTARRALRRLQGGLSERRVGRHHGRWRRVRAPGARHGARHDEDPRSRQEHGGPSRVDERRRERGCARQRRRCHRQWQG
jgi:hypothetical protein